MDLMEFWHERKNMRVSDKTKYQCIVAMFTIHHSTLVHLIDTDYQISRNTKPILEEERKECYMNPFWAKDDPRWKYTESRFLWKQAITYYFRHYH